MRDCTVFITTATGPLSLSLSLPAVRIKQIREHRSPFSQIPLLFLSSHFSFSNKSELKKAGLTLICFQTTQEKNTFFFLLPDKFIVVLLLAYLSKEPSFNGMPFSSTVCVCFLLWVELGGGGCSLFVSVIGSVDGFGSCLKT